MIFCYNGKQQPTTKRSQNPKNCHCDILEYDLSGKTYIQIPNRVKKVSTHTRKLFPFIDKKGLEATARTSERHPRAKPTDGKMQCNNDPSPSTICTLNKGVSLQQPNRANDGNNARQDSTEHQSQPNNHRTFLEK